MFLMFFVVVAVAVAVAGAKSLVEGIGGDAYV